MLNPNGKADGLYMPMLVALGGWKQWPGEIYEWLRVWCFPGSKPNAARVREDGKGGYEWWACMPDGRDSKWQPCENGQAGRNAADEWLMAQNRY